MSPHSACSTSRRRPRASRLRARPRGQPRQRPGRAQPRRRLLRGGAVRRRRGRLREGARDQPGPPQRDRPMAMVWHVRGADERAIARARARHRRGARPPGGALRPRAHPLLAAGDRGGAGVLGARRRDRPDEQARPGVAGLRRPPRTARGRRRSPDRPGPRRRPGTASPPRTAYRPNWSSTTLAVTAKRSSYRAGGRRLDLGEAVVALAHGPRVEPPVGRVGHLEQEAAGTLDDEPHHQVVELLDVRDATVERDQKGLWSGTR